MLGSVSEKGQEEPLVPQGTKKHKEGRCSCPKKTEGGCSCGKKLMKKSTYLDPDVIPEGGLEEHRTQFESFWSLYNKQIIITNSMDLDIFPGQSFNTHVWPVVWHKTPQHQMNVIQDLAKLAIQKHNKEPSNVFKYQLLHIEKANGLYSGHLEYFMTVKVLNLTLATVIETFQIYAGAPLFKFHQFRHGLAVPSEDDVYSFTPKGGGLFCTSEEEEVDSRQLSPEPEKKPNSAKELLDWQKKLPHRFLDDEVPWDDRLFIPQGASNKYTAIFHRIYRRYFNQIRETQGFDIDIYPGKALAATHAPYLDFATEFDLLMDLAKHAIEDYNNTANDDYKYAVEYVEKVNCILAECREFFMTVKVKNLTLGTPVETFQIHAYKGPDMENVVRTCRRKLFEPQIDLLMDLAKHAIEDYSNTANDDYKYEVEYVEKVNYSLPECREFFMTVKAKNLTLRTGETFQIHVYKGPDTENVVRTCRRNYLS